MEWKMMVENITRYIMRKKFRDSVLIVLFLLLVIKLMGI